MSSIIERYEEASRLLPTTTFLVRMGDFYEAFGKTAKAVAEALGLAVTQRQGTPMTGIGAWSVEQATTTLLKHGMRVVLIEDMKTFSLDKTLVDQTTVDVRLAREAMPLLAQNEPLDAAHALAVINLLSIAFSVIAEAAKPKNIGY